MARGKEQPHQPTNNQDDRLVERRALYDRGLDDPQIAKAEGVSVDVVFRWRGRLGLPSARPRGRNGVATNTAPLTPELKRRCLALLERGIGAIQINRETGVARQSLDKWRSAMLKGRPDLRRPPCAARPTRRHANGNAFSKLRSDRRAQAFLLYADGLNDGAIAAELGISAQQVWKWRQALYLPATHPRGGISLGGKRKAHRKPLGERISPLSNPLHASIMEAIGRGVAADVADDAASEMWLALLEGRLTPEQIKSEGRRYCGRAIATYASRFTPRSLDEDLGDGDGFRMLDLIRDERSASWLEEMGATVY